MTDAARRQVLVRTAGAAAFITFGLVGAAERPVRPPVHVYKSSSCTCCGKWIAHLRDAGFPVTVQDVEDVAAIKDELKVPAAARSCHTAKVGAYFLEGHVPAEHVVRLLTSQPKALGLAVPGMPIGSPGMEVDGVAAQAFDVIIVQNDGSSAVFAKVPAGR